MLSAQAYLPSDRRRGAALPELDRGVVLFADISGFTHLTNSLVERLGPRRGAEEATHHLNTVYTALVRVIHAAGGSVVSFSGDGMLCWFAAGDDLAATARRALGVASGLQGEMARRSQLTIAPGHTVELGLKVALAAGRVRRMLVGDPAIQVFDVIAGPPVDQVGAAEPLAGRGETIAARSLLDVLGGDVIVAEWRSGADGQLYALLDLAGQTEIVLDSALDAASATVADPVDLDDEAVRPWLFPAVYARLAGGQERFLAELRPGLALFLHIGERDLVGDAEAAHLLDRYVRWVQGVLARDDALLVQVTTGDKGIYLYGAFGALVLHEDEAARAASAALALLTPPADVAAIGPVQIGLAQGRMRVGAYGSDERRTFGVQGAAVNLAARLMMVAPADGVVVEQMLAQQLESGFALAETGAVALKGMAHPLPLFRVVSMRDTAQRSVAGARRLLGRDVELAWMEECAGQVEAGAGRVVQLGGEAGIGKSALLRAWAAMLRQRGWQVAQSEAYSMQRHAPYASLGRLPRSLLGLSAPRQGKAALARVREWFAAADPSWLPRLPLLVDVLGLPAEMSQDAVGLGLDPETRHKALTGLVIDMVARWAASRPVALLVDDGQWLDEASAAVLGALAETVADQRVLLVLARRGSEALPGEPQPDSVLSLTLPPLDPVALAALAADQTEAPLEPLAAELVNALAQGSPLLLAQIVDALRADGRLVEQEGQVALSADTVDKLRADRALVASETGWHFAESGLAIGPLLGLPDSLHGLMLARVDRLPEDAKLTLKLASVVGRSFTMDVVVGAHPLQADAAQVVAQLGLLQDEGLVAVGQEGGPGVYRFEHNLTQELVYQTLLSTQQQELHGQVGAALERYQPDAVVSLAQHFYLADLQQPGVRAKALLYLEQAAERVRAEFANETALRFLDQALGLEVRASWRQARVKLLHLVGRRQDEAAALDDLARTPGASLIEHGVLESRYHEAVNDYGRAQTAAAAALALAVQAGDAAAQASCLVQLARVVGREGDYASEGRYYQRAYATLGEHTADHDIGVEIYYGLGVDAKQQGDLGAADLYFERALAMARAHTLPMDEARILTARGIVARLERRFDEAYHYTERSLAIRRLVGDRAGESASLMSLAQVVIHGLGDYGRGRDLLVEALGMVRRLQDRWSQGIVLNELGIVYLLVGEWDQAERHLLDALAICKEIGAEGGEAHVLCNLGQVQRGQGRWDVASGTFARGAAIAERLQDPQVQAQYWGETALLALEQGHAARAYELAGQAVAAWRDLDLAVMATADLCTQAEAAQRLGEESRAAAHARAAFELLEACRGEGPDYPQRDYYRVACVLAHSDPATAAQARATARTLLEARSQRIGDESLAASFLYAIPIHAALAADGPERPIQTPPEDRSAPGR